MKAFNLKIVYNGNKGGLVTALEQVTEEIRSGITDDIGRDFIGEVEDPSGNVGGYSYHETDYEYGDIYGNSIEELDQMAKEFPDGGDNAKNKT